MASGGEGMNQVACGACDPAGVLRILRHVPSPGRCLSAWMRSLSASSRHAPFETTAVWSVGVTECPER